MPEMVSIGRHHHRHGGAVNKLTKARGKMVKPILKKLAPSPKNSLDLDRGWDEQQIEQMENSDWSGHGGGVAAIGASSRASSVRDMNFGFSGGYEGNLVAAGGGSGSSIRSKFHHGRSASQASTGSGPSRGAFVHPFAQTPRTATPPLSYANSLASFDNTTNYTGGRDCSPTITEDEDDEDKFDTDYSGAQGKTPHHSTSNAPPAALSSQSNLRRPSLQSQRTSSYTEVPSKPPSLRINTAGGTPRSVSGATVVSRLAHGSSVSAASQSDLHLASSVSVPVGGALDSPTGSLGAGTINNSSSGATQMSPLRSSLDMAGFPRLRSRSELDTASRAENIRAARRKFEEREKIKEEKYDREMIKKRERKDNKEASRIEKGETVRPSVQRKNTAGSISTLSSPKLHGPTVFSRKGASRALESTNNSRNDLAASGYESSSAPPMGVIGRRHTDSPSAEKHMGFASRKYDSVPLQTPPAFGPNVDDVRFEQTRPRRGSNTKRKTQSYWAGFMLWLRTKLLRMGR